MRLSVTFVPVRKIKPSLSRWNFSQEAVEQAARLVAKLEGIINPLVLRQEENSTAYEVLDGNFEYYVVARASELEPHSCETIAAFIIDPEDEALIQEQIQIFRREQRLSQDGFTPATDLDSRLKLLELRQADLETRQRSLELAETKPIKQQLQKGGVPSNPKADLLALFNQMEREALLQCLRQAGLIGRNAEKIVAAIEEERQHQEFRSLKEVVLRVRGLTYEKIVDLLEAV